MERRAGRISLSRTQRGLIAVVVSGAVVIAGIGFAGSYTAVRDLAVRKGFGAFATVFPIGVDAGIAVLLALDLLLTWLRIPFPMLRQAAWLLTAATIGFNAAAAWPDLVGVGMHGVIPILFVVTVEAARHAVGRLAAITADRHMEGVRLWRWLLAPLPTFRLWRRMMLWEIRKYDDVIAAEQQRLVYQTRLRGRYGRGWRWKAPVEELLPLRIARYGVPLEAASSLRQGAAKTEAQLSPELEMHADSDASGPRPHLEVPDRPGRTSQGEQAEEGTPAFEERPVQEERPPDEGDESVVGRDGGVPMRREDLSASPVGATASTLRSARHAESTQRAQRPGDAATSQEPGGSQVVGSTVGLAGPESNVPVPPQASPPAEERVPDTAAGAEAEGADHSGHESAVARLKSNAAAVRYAMSVLGSTHTPTVVDWLAAHGREVNRGQAHKITKDEEERQQRAQRLSVVKDSS